MSGKEPPSDPFTNLPAANDWLLGKVNEMTKDDPAYRAASKIVYSRKNNVELAAIIREEYADLSGRAEAAEKLAEASKSLLMHLRENNLHPIDYQRLRAAVEAYETPLPRP